MAKVFVSYSHADEALWDELQKHLAVLKRAGTISPWHDRRLLAGDDLDGAILKQLLEADIILLLVSKDFLASGYCYEVEFERALERHRAESARVIPIILRHCDWQATPIGKLVAVPRDGRPVTAWPDRDEAFLDVVQKIRECAKVANSDEQKVGQILESPAGRHQAPREASPRSSNLSLKKEFSDVDKDRFRHAAFEFMGKFFDGSLKELALRNEGIETRFNQIDSERFTGVIYRNGRKVSACTVSNGSGYLSNSITYSAEESARRGSYNESLSVEFDDQKLYLQSMGMQMMGRDDQRKLTFEGASELYWEMLIEHLQR